VRRDQPSRLQWVLDDRERAAGELTRDFELDADPAEPHRLPFGSRADRYLETRRRIVEAAV
jgi:hypothetical protein